MPCQLIADCLDEIFEFLKDDKFTLHSCLLVSRLWCEVSVRILWRNNFSPQVFCLPNESKNLLHKNGIFISTPTSKPLLFNYASFCKVLSVDQLNRMVKNFLKSQQTSRNLNSDQDLVMQEIFKMFMKQTTLKKISYLRSKINIPYFTQFPGAKDCLTGLSKLHCYSDIPSEFYYQLSQICHNIQSINIRFEFDNDTFSNGLEQLISSQNSLKCLSLTHLSTWVDINFLLLRCSNTLIKLKIDHIFNISQCVTLPQLQILKIQNGYLNKELLIKFLEIHGKKLKEFHLIIKQHDGIYWAIAKFCLNLKSLYIEFTSRGCESITLIIIFQGCKQLEKIKIMLDDQLTYGQIFKIVVEHSPKNFQELELVIYMLELTSKELESFFISWKNRISQKPISLIIENLKSLDIIDENMKIIEKYKKLGIIKKFEAKKKSIKSKCYLDYMDYIWRNDDQS